ncbi:sulfite exporter TauE/SafE family protein [Aurantimonas sp. HBX-1]|uniref:sulfite exporter TauE/SafE family protein n=1 Tax=Aurantimonas sp. HBX-1 TaxID=2906072 RepID=UPI001F30D586|nr:sulfite exporter TauE/SafE family protein [Aurantimonas sp. HBX-1]UIJ70877.1 sulfite exporter TauE/SafE family protein [Aurantimonas sp. HBX-1]
MITDPLFYAFAIPSVLLVGLSKGGIGSTLTLLAVPLMAFVIDPVTAAGILLPILVATDLIGLVAWRGEFDRAVLLSTLPAAFGGVAFGYFAAALVPPDGIRVVLGLLSLWFAVRWFVSSRHETRARAPSRLRAGFWSALSGFASFVSHAGAPPYQIYVMPLRLPPSIYAGTSVIFFAAVNAAKLPAYFLLGQFSAQNLATSAVLLPLALVATLAGVWIVRRIDAAAFYWIAYGALVPVGLKLTYDGIVGLSS